MNIESLNTGCLKDKDWMLAKWQSSELQTSVLLRISLKNWQQFIRINFSRILASKEKLATKGNAKGIKHG